MVESRIGNYQSCCRLCLTEKHETLLNVFDETANDRNLAQKILAFVAVEITSGDKLTTLVCKPCISKVYSWVLYKESCSRNQGKLERWLNQSHNANPEENIQIKIEPTDVLDPDNDGEEYLGVNKNGDIQDISDMLVPETRIKPEPMELEYNEFPLEMSPQTPQFNLMDSEDSQTSISSSTKGDPLQSRKCRYCHKTFSSSGNRIRHERLLHGAKKKQLASKESTPVRGTPDDDRSQASTNGVEKTEDPELDKIQFAAGLSLLQKDAVPLSTEPLTKIEISYVEKCKAMVDMYQTLRCACHKVKHHNVKGLLSHLRSLKVWFPVFTCYSCMITFTDRSSFTKHNLACRRPQLESCKKLSNLRKRTSVKIRLYQNYRCAECKFMYSFHDQFCKHVDEEHVEGSSPYECSCGRQFNSVEDFKDHAYVSCFVEYYCDVCFVVENSMDGFRKHCEEAHDHSDGFLLQLDDDYKLRRSLTVKEKVEEKPPEENIVVGKRRSSFYSRPIMDDFDDDEEEEEVDEGPRKKFKGMPMIPPYDEENPGQCPLCDKLYSSYHNMTRHYRTHSEVNIPQDDSIYSCPDCGGMYNSDQWRIHLSDSHKPMKCTECGKLFQFKTELDQHRSVHLNLKISRDSKTRSYTSTMLSPNSDGELGCEACDAVFKSPEDLEKHNISVHQITVKKEMLNANGTPKFTCKRCDKHYTWYSGLYDHNRRKHPEMRPPIRQFPKKCKLCDKVCSTGASYAVHKQMHERMNHMAQNIQVKKEKVGDEEVEEEEDDQESYYTCHKCFKVFSAKSTFQKHMKSHGTSPNTKNSKTGIKKVWCNICHTSCDSLEGLKKHKEEEHGNADQKTPMLYTCSVCVMTFSNKIALKKHKETHLDDKKPNISSITVYCKHCRIAFDSVAKLANHMREEHDETLQNKVEQSKDKRAFVCGICKKGFNTALALNAHSGWHKRGPLTNDKVVKQNKIVDKYVQIINKPPQTTKPPEFQCSTCLQELPNDTALQIHILEKHRHIDAIMLVPRCNICNQDFNNQEEYETHKRLHDLLERQKKHDSQKTTTPTSSMLIQKKVVKNFHCAYCPASFTRQDTFNTHMRQNHKEHLPAPEFKCFECNRVFEKQNALTIHLKTHQKPPNITVTSTISSITNNSANTNKQYSCSICNMGFDLPKDLRTHTIKAHPF